MDRSTAHRKRVRHYDDPTDVRELTFSCYGRRPLLTNDTWRAMLAESVDRAMERHSYRLAAYVFMPEHVHLLCYPVADASEIEALLKAIKRPFAYRLKQKLMQSKSHLLQRLTVRTRPGVTAFRFWQEGPGYDRNLTNPATAMAAIDYIHLNPVRRGLVTRADEWKWSSARFYAETSCVELPKVYQLPATWLADAE
jgi:putative transposase